MYLSTLDLRSAPGLPDGIRLDDLSPGCVLLHGPNASGKSTIGRTIRGVLWPERTPADVDARTTWHQAPNGPPILATTVFGRSRWATGQEVHIPGDLADAAQLTLRDLLLPRGGSDDAIAERIQRELDGGYNLQALQLGTDLRVKPLPTVKRDHDTGRSRLRALLSESDTLAREEDRLDALRTAADEAASAPRRRAWVQQAQQALDLRREITALESELADLPEDLAGLPADAEEQGRAAMERARRASERIDELTGAIEAARARVSEHSFAHGAPTREALESRVEAARQLLTQQRAMADARRQLATAEARVKAAAAQVWAGGTGEAVPGRADLERLVHALTDVRDRRAELHAAPTPPEVRGSPIDERAEEQLREARTLLREWLAAPRQVVVHAEARSRPGWTALVAAAGLLLAVIGVGVAIAANAVVGLCLLAVGLGLVGFAAGTHWAFGAPHPHTDAPASPELALAERYRQRRHPAVDAWTVQGVERTVSALEESLRAGLAARDQAREAARYAAKQTNLKAALHAAEATRDALIAELGLVAELGDLSLVHQAQRVDALAAAHIDARAARAALDDHAQTLAAGRERLRGWLASLSLDALPTLDNDDNLLPAAQHALRRAEELTGATQRLADLRVGLRPAEADATAAATERDAMLQRFGVSADTIGELSARVETASTRAAIEARRRDARGQLSRLSQDLPADLPEDAEGLAHEEARLRMLEDRYQQLNAEVAEIEQRIKLATQAGTIEDALATQQRGLVRLADDRDRQLEAQAGAALMTWLRNERRQHDTPALLDRARRWFLSFTHQRYELQVGAEQRFVARDLHTGRVNALSELSDGTRVQLLLAARLAYIEASEGEHPLPLFLDEVLSTSDRARFRAIATAVLQLAARGRQVFYATSAPAEVQAWQAVAAEEGLAAPQVRHLPTALTADTWAEAPALPDERRELPPIENRDAVGWCAASGMPRPDLRAPVERWPLALVLYDELSDVRSAAQAGLERVGQLELAETGVPLPMADALVSRANSRVRAIRAALDAMRVGRGAPVTWDAVAASGAVTPAFEDRMRAALEAHPHDAEAFCSAVAGISRFRDKNVKELRDHLELVGILDARERLDPGQIESRTQRAVRADLSAGRLSLADVTELVGWVARVVRVQ